MWYYFNYIIKIEIGCKSDGIYPDTLAGHISQIECKNSNQIGLKLCENNGIWGKEISSCDSKRISSISLQAKSKKLPEGVRIPLIFVVLLIGIVLSVYNSIDHTKVVEEKHEKIVHCTVRDKNENKDGDIVIDPTPAELEMRRSRISSRDGALPLFDKPNDSVNPPELIPETSAENVQSPNE